MMIAIPRILDEVALATVRAKLDHAEWIDGNATSGHQAALAKRNRQLDEESPGTREIGNLVLDALGRSPLFVAAALPLKVYPPLFNRYDADGDRFDAHVDSAIRIRRGSDFRLRTDLSATLFLSDPADYDGGELVVEDEMAPPPIKLAAGDMILYPASSLHRVTAVTRGTRFAAFFWVQSMVRGGEDRRALFDLDSAIQAIAADRGHGDGEVIRLTGVYHNLLRRWAEL